MPGVRAEVAGEDASARLEARGDGRYSVHGGLVLETVVALLEAGAREFAREPATEIDLAAVSDADSAGLALLLEWLRQAQSAGRRLTYRAVPARLDAIARIGGVRELLDPA